jgi:hypothetical protein
MQQLCALVAEKNDHDKFLNLVRELNNLLERKGWTLTRSPNSD